jgi:anaerobic selenocysteine-containing dehydrogenase
VNEDNTMTTKLTSMLKVLGALLATGVLGALALGGCQSQQSTQEAYTTCNELLAASPSKDDPEVFQDCVACHEDCGTDCNEEATSPVTYACPDEEGTGSGSAGGG